MNILSVYYSCVPAFYQWQVCNCLRSGFRELCIFPGEVPGPCSHSWREHTNPITFQGIEDWVIWNGKSYIGLCFNENHLKLWWLRLGVLFSGRLLAKHEKGPGFRVLDLSTRSTASLLNPNQKSQPRISTKHIPNHHHQTKPRTLQSREAPSCV